MSKSFRSLCWLGDRLLGAGIAGVKTYHGIDPNSALTEPYKEMINYLNSQWPLTDSITHKPINRDFKVLTEDFLKVDIENNSYDTVFTSPPFFDFEIYTDEASQSISNKPTIQDWIDKFYRPYLNKAWDALEIKGKMFIYIADNRETQGLVAATMNIMKEIGAEYKGVIAIVNDDLKRPFPMWVWFKE